MRFWFTIPRTELQKADYKLLLGTYQITLDPKFIPSGTVQSVVNYIKSKLPKEKQVLGKSVVLTDIWKTNGHVVLVLTVRENPVPILAILGALGFLVGGFLVWQIIVEVRKLITLDGVVKNPIFSVIMVLAVVGVVGFAIQKLKQ